MDTGPIQIIPPGLLGFLQLKSQGKNPSLLADTYLPCIEMRDWMFQAERESVTDTLTLGAGANAPGTYAAYAGVAAIVPNGEFWWVHSASIIFDITAAESIAARPAWFYDTGGSNFGIQLIADTVTWREVVGTARRLAFSLNNFFAPPNSRLGLLIEAATGAGYTNNATVRNLITRLPI